MERKGSVGLPLKDVAVDDAPPDVANPDTAHTPHIDARIRSLSDAFEPTKPDTPKARRNTELKLVSTSLVEERFNAGEDVKFSEDDEEAIIVKVDQGQWQIGFNGDDGPR